MRKVFLKVRVVIEKSCVQDMKELDDVKQICENDKIMQDKNEMVLANEVLCVE